MWDLGPQKERKEMKEPLFSCKRVGWVYLLAFMLLIVLVFLNRPAFYHTRMETLSRLKPGYDYWQEFSPENRSPDLKKLAECAFYHQKVAEYIPSMSAEAWNMVGFCSSKAGKTKEALRAYRKALTTNPTFFWTFYNLGIIYLERNQYAQAMDMFQSALKTQSRFTIMAIMTSKVYMDVLHSTRIPVNEIAAREASGRAMAQKLLMSSILCQADPQKTECVEGGSVQAFFF
jgi:tetratricopeptide (TPR) repeat protein